MIFFGKPLHTFPDHALAQIRLIRTGIGRLSAGILDTNRMSAAGIFSDNKDDHEIESLFNFSGDFACLISAFSVTD
jgi:hypothetical protein